MTGTTKTIAFRVSQSVDEQIQEIAKADGRTKGDWVRDRVMQALHAMSPRSVPELEEPTEASDSPASLLLSLETRIQETENVLREEIDAVKTAIAKVAKSQHEDLCTMAQVGLTVEESMEQRIEATRDQVLDAIERLKQSQRSHTDTFLRAIAER